MIDSLKESPDQLSELKIVKDVVERILELQKEKNVLILGHNYMEPKVYHLSPKQYRGDSLQL
ncbi:quinolinate synthase NadA, partial [Candidatus Woesearchaeota archaeon]|nr:quinolinate synthase NadA [Candidatus Woesearchaeota archaeon]